MSRKRVLFAAFIVILGVLTVFSVVAAQEPELSDVEQLGKDIFFDENLSINNNQSCATCHTPAAGWVGPDSAINSHGAVYEGSIPGRFGNRKPPSAAYATLSPVLYMDKKGLWVGGNFWDGRATGWTLGNPAAEQAQGPFLNPLEQALPSSSEVVARVCAATYGDLFRQVWGTAACAPGKEAMAYDYIAFSIAAYEASPEVNAFTSKYDYSLVNQATLSKAERKGFALFQGKGKCKLCHTSSGAQPLFTDFTFDNLGVPRNPENPFYTNLEYNPLGFDWIDTGLGGFLQSAGYEETIYMAEWGKQKVPTLRNVGLGLESGIVKDYGHNGYFKSLKGIVHFYNTRDVKPTCSGAYTEAQALAADCWPAPEVAANVNTAELGNLGLTPEEEDAIVAFLMTLSDGYLP